jgi:hypothetical protein
MGMLAAVPAFVAAMVAALLPYRHWERLPYWIPVRAAAFASGLATLLGGAAIGIPGFLEHAAANVSLANDTMLKYDFFNRSLSAGFGGLSIFTFMLLTPKGWLTSYLLATGTVRGMGAWFDDPIGDPVLTGLDALVGGRREKRANERQRRERAALEGPELADRVVSSAKAGIPGCDLVIVSTRRKPGWDRGTTVFTTEAAYRIGEPVERTVAGRLRTLYPLTEHKDFEAVRKSVHYDLPIKAGHDGAADEEPRTTADRSA